MKPCPMFCVCDKCSSVIASGHRDGDEKLGRNWLAGEGCGCAACRLLRKNLAEKTLHVPGLSTDGTNTRRSKQ